MILSDVTSEEIARELKNTEVAILPVGAIEQHGPHLPLSSDVLVPVEVAKLIAAKLRAIVIPAVMFGNSGWMMDWPGTIALRNETLIEVVKDICTSLEKHGIKLIVIINGHDGNIGALEIVSDFVRDHLRAKLAVVHWWRIAREEINAISETHYGFHADEVETSVMMHVRPDLVKADRLVSDFPKFPKYVANFGGNEASLSISYSRKFLRYGVIGDATKASAEKGRQIIEAVVINTVKLIEAVRDQGDQDHL